MVKALLRPLSANITIPRGIHERTLPQLPKSCPFTARVRRQSGKQGTRGGHIGKFCSPSQRINFSWSKGLGVFVETPPPPDLIQNLDVALRCPEKDEGTKQEVLRIGLLLSEVILYF